MLNPQKLDKAFTKFMSDLGKWVQDGIIEVDLELLKKYGLLNKTEEEEKEMQKNFPFYFHVLEVPEKVTLFNNQFVIWIVPKVVNEVPTTFTLITLVNGDDLNLELVFSTTGIYNSPKYVLKVLRHLLTEVIDTEEEIASLGRAEGA
ncbi:MAG: hypothetical protein S4CHLAM102_13070 [Chlamydiia bacterium]|nr:hypothetical protein [Chlamydiia bacterium]